MAEEKHRSARDDTTREERDPREDDGWHIRVVELVALDSAVNPVRQLSSRSDCHRRQQLLPSNISYGKDAIHVRLLILIDDDIAVLLELDADLVDAEIIGERVTTDREEHDVGFDGFPRVDVDGLEEGDGKVGRGNGSNDLRDVRLGVDLDARVLHVLLKSVLEERVERFEDLLATDEEVRLGA